MFGQIEYFGLPKIQNMRAFYAALLFTLISLGLSAQPWNNNKDFTRNTFSNTRIISAQSVETLPAKVLDFRISHRFGDMFVEDVNIWNNWFGLAAISDVYFGLEYGILDDLMVGLGRYRGSGAAQSPFALYVFFAKYRILKQTADNQLPLSITLHANVNFTAMQKFDAPGTPSDIQSTADRFSYMAELIVARKFCDYFSLQLSGIYLHRSLVGVFDENDNLGIGLSTRIGMTKTLALIIEYHYMFSKYRNDDDYRSANNITQNFFHPLGVGLEIVTNKHVFHINFTNSQDILGNHFLPYTTKNWFDAEFRLGFTISRHFSLGRKEKI